MADRDREAFDGFYDRMYRTDRVEQHQYAARESEDGRRLGASEED